jgi:hypothetical protein
MGRCSKYRWRAITAIRRGAKEIKIVVAVCQGAYPLRIARLSSLSTARASRSILKRSAVIPVRIEPKRTQEIRIKEVPKIHLRSLGLGKCGFEISAIHPPALRYVGRA